MSPLDFYRTLETLGIAFACFVILWIFYRAIYKRPWTSHLAQGIIARTRLYAYLVPFFGAFRIALVLRPQPELTLLGTALSNIVILTLLLIVIETLTGLLFDSVLATDRDVDIPNIFRDLTRIVLYVAAGIICLKAMLNLDVAPLLTGSAILSVVIGLALQESLGNLFSGLVLHGSQPFSRGEWIAVGVREGRVEKVDWRSTTLRTTSGDHIVIPNSILAKETITNFSTPSPLHARLIQVPVAMHHPPARIASMLLDCALKADHVHTEPKPKVRLKAFGDSALVYEIKFWVTEFEQYPDIESNVRKKIWYRFRREGVEIPYPHVVRLTSETPPQEQDLHLHLTLFRHIDFLSEFDQTLLERLAERIRVLIYSPGEVIINQGEAGHSFYIVREGRVEVQARDKDGHMFFCKELTRGSFFGEISLLTGEPRSATVVALEDSTLLRVDKEAFRVLMENNPRAEELISTVLARRQEYSEVKDASAQRRAEDTTREQAMEESSRKILKRIRDFFAY